MFTIAWWLLLTLLIDSVIKSFFPAGQIIHKFIEGFIFEFIASFLVILYMLNKSVFPRIKPDGESIGFAPMMTLKWCTFLLDHRNCVQSDTWNLPIVVQKCKALKRGTTHIEFRISLVISPLFSFELCVQLLHEEVHVVSAWDLAIHLPGKPFDSTNWFHQSSRKRKSTA